MRVNPKEEWVNERMKRLTARPFCPKCFLFLEEHNNSACDMRYEEDLPCVSCVPKQPSLESLCLLVGDSGFTV